MIYVYFFIGLSLIKKKNVGDDIKFLCVNICHKVINDNQGLRQKAQQVYNYADEEFVIYKYNIYENQSKLEQGVMKVK